MPISSGSQTDTVFFAVAEHTAFEAESAVFRYPGTEQRRVVLLPGLRVGAMTDRNRILWLAFGKPARHVAHRDQHGAFSSCRQDSRLCHGLREEAVTNGARVLSKPHLTKKHSSALTLR